MGASVTITGDHARIAFELDRFLTADPVRSTVLGTIRDSLSDTSWAAFDGDRLLAVRSAAAYPLEVHGPWSPDQLEEALHGLDEVRAMAGEPELMAAVGSRFAGGQVVERREEILHRLTRLIDPVRVEGIPLIAGGSDRETVTAWTAAFVAEIGHRLPVPGMIDRLLDGQGCWLWRAGDGQPMAMAARRPAVHGSSRIGPVYTPPEFRGRGFGAVVTAAATRDVLNDGAVPVLFTDAANPISNRLYARLGYEVVERRVALTFTSPTGAGARPSHSANASKE